MHGHIIVSLQVIDKEIRMTEITGKQRSNTASNLHI